jgi:hypothetical protein
VTLGLWLSERSADVPPRLTARIDEALGPRRAAPYAEATVQCLDAAEVLLRDLLSREATGRESALDLLTVDALVTYAFEAASDDPSSLQAFATSAAARFAAATAGPSLRSG